MRLAGISSMEAGNAFLASYMNTHNPKFAVKPASDVDAHRSVLHNQQELDCILSIHSGRKLSKNLTLQYNNTLYQVKIKGIGYAMRGAAVTVCEDFQSNVTLLYNGKVLTYETWKRGEKPPAIRDAKEINQAVIQAIQSHAQHKNWKPAPDHPWRKPLRRQTNKRKILSGRKPEISTLG